MRILAVDRIKNELIEVYDHRSILHSLVVKNLVGRYKNSIFGFLWHFFTPILSLFVYYVAFTELRSATMDYYWIYLSSGLFPFVFMLSSLNSSTTMIIGNSAMIKKMYFPRCILILSQIISSFIILLIGYFVVAISILVAGFELSYLITLTPIVLFLLFCFVFGYSLIFSAITVYVRDVQFLLSSLSMAFFFLTPMYFTIDSISGILETIVWLNPFTYFIDFFHHIIYYKTMPGTITIIGCIILSITSLIIGGFTFKKLEKKFAEFL